MKEYEAPELFVDEYAADSTIAASGGGGHSYKNGHAGTNQNCAGCRFSYGAGDPYSRDDWCNYVVTNETTQDDLDFFC